MVKEKNIKLDKLSELLDNIKSRLPFSKPQKAFVSKKKYNRNKNKQLTKKEASDES